MKRKMDEEIEACVKRAQCAATEKRRKRVAGDLDTQAKRRKCEANGSAALDNEATILRCFATLSFSRQEALLKRLLPEDQIILSSLDDVKKEVNSLLERFEEDAQIWEDLLRRSSYLPPWVH